LDREKEGLDFEEHRGKEATPRQAKLGWGNHATNVDNGMRLLQRGDRRRFSKKDVVTGGSKGTLWTEASGKKKKLTRGARGSNCIGGTVPGKTAQQHRIELSRGTKPVGSRKLGGNRRAS